MKLIKYIFLGPFSLKNQWINFKTDSDNLADRREAALLLFFSFVVIYFIGLFVEPYVYTDYDAIPFYFTFGNIVKIYLILIVKLVFTYFLISGFVRSLMKQTIDTFPLINLILCSLALIWSFHFVFSFVFDYFIARFINYYTIISFLKKFAIAGVSSLVLVNALYGYFHEQSLKSGSKLNMFIFIAISFVGINFILDLIISYLNNIMFLF
jgi:hypothetical protein